MRFIFMLAAALALLLPATVSAQHKGPAWTTIATMKRGVNIIGYDPLWRDPAKARFQTRHFGIIKAGGFDFVRVVLSGFRHMDADNKLSPQFFTTLDWVVKEASAAGLTVILDEHDFTYCAANADPCETKLIAFWQQVGEHYRNAPRSVLFELLNEPNGQLDAARWNAMIAKVLPIVRATNPHRTVVIGPVRWNNLGELPNLVLPKADRNIIVTFHSYEPFRFTHQGASWAGEVKNLHDIPFTAEDEAAIAGDCDKVQAWSKAEDRPILMGEFGAYDRSGIPIADRARYTATVRREAEKRGFAWAYWQFDSDFVLWDMEKDAWVEPIRKALIPEG